MINDPLLTGFFKISLLFIVIMIIVGVLLGIRTSNKKKQLKKYNDIYIGMLEEDMLSIMGKGYNKSSLRDGSFKYEWRINATSTGYSNNGISSRKYSGVKKVDIYTKNGKVVEIKPHNV